VQRVSKRDANRAAHRYAQQAVAQNIESIVSGRLAYIPEHFLLEHEQQRLELATATCLQYGSSGTEEPKNRNTQRNALVLGDARPSTKSTTVL